MHEVPNETVVVHYRETQGGRILKYDLNVVQPPQRARACGSGKQANNDRRPVDPPPVVRLQILEKNPNSTPFNDVPEYNDITASYEASFMMFASLEHARPYARGGLNPTSHCPVLTGGTAAAAAYLSKPISAAYFIFPDLSVRHEGFYRFKFHLFEQAKNVKDLDYGHPQETYADGLISAPAPDPHKNMVMQTCLYSTPFQVFSAKKFPGLGNSTDLSKCIAEQGCRVRIRRDIRQRKSEAKPSKKTDETPSLRATSRDRGSEVQDQWSRPTPIDTRRPSIESQYSQNCGPSRQPSYSHLNMRSPSTTGSINQYPPPAPYNISSPLVAEPENMHAQHQRQSQSIATPQSHITPNPTNMHSLPPFSSRTTCQKPSGLPSIAALMNGEPPNSCLPRPQDLYDTKPILQKRGFSQSRSETAAPLKDGARPQLTPMSRRSGAVGLPPFPDYSNTGSKLPLAGGDSLIEADVDDDDDGEISDYDALLENMREYKRADGKMHSIPDRR